MVITVKTFVSDGGEGRAGSNWDWRRATVQYNFALSTIIESMPDTTAPTPLHVVGRFDNPYTGAERSLPDLAAGLRGRRETQLWSDVPPDPVFVEQGVRAIRPFAQEYPRGGMLLIGGVHVQLGPWLEYAQPERIALRYNLPNHLRLFEAIARIRAATGIDPELIFVSRAIQLSVGLPGRVEPSLIKLDDYLKLPVERVSGAPVTVGRVSRDVIEKHDPQDVALYRMLAARGVRVRIMGGTCLGRWLQDVPGVELLPVGAEEVTRFLGSLDIFFYRTGTFTEPYGRVVLEAMAAGLPVVVAANGGYVEQISPGVEGFPIRGQEEAIHVLQRLVQSAALRQQVGTAARARAIAVHGPAAMSRMLENYAT